MVTHESILLRIWIWFCISRIVLLDLLGQTSICLLQQKTYTHWNSSWKWCLHGPEFGRPCNPELHGTISVLGECPGPSICRPAEKHHSYPTLDPPLSHYTQEYVTCHIFRGAYVHHLEIAWCSAIEIARVATFQVHHLPWGFQLMKWCRDRWKRPTWKLKSGLWRGRDQSAGTYSKGPISGSIVPSSSIEPEFQKPC